MASRIAVIDFETTGSSPGQGARATEVAIVIVERGAVVDSYQNLMNGGVWCRPSSRSSPASPTPWWPRRPGV